MECLDFDFWAKHSLRNRQKAVWVYVAAIALEVRMRFHFNIHDQVAGRPTLPCIAFLGHTQVNPRINTLRHTDRLFHRAMMVTSAWAINARRPNYTSIAVAASTNLLNGEGTLFDGLIAGTAACPTSGRMWTRPAPTTFTCFTLVVAIESNDFLRALYSLHKFNLQINVNIWAFRLHFLTGSGPMVKHFLKIIVGISIWALPKLIIKSLIACKALAIISGIWVFCLLISVEACLVVDTSFSLIAQSGVCSWDVREALLCLGWFIYVGVVLLRQLEIGLLDVILSRILPKTKLIVEVWVVAAVRGAKVPDLG
jgi:hypothetical protein